MGFPPPLGTDGTARESGRCPYVHHVGVVHRRDDRSRDGLQRGPQTEPRFRSGGCRRIARGKLDEAIKIADRYKKSHLAKVVVAGLQEFQAHQSGSEISGEEIDASRRALERSEAIVHAELKRGVSALATIGSTAPFVGLFGTVVGIINAFKTMAAQKTPGIGAIAGGISEALVTTAIGLFVAVPAVWAFNYFTGRVDAFDVEMGNSSSELLDYFLKRIQLRAGVRK